MGIETFWGKMGCGMGMCYPGQKYLKDRKVDSEIKIEDYPEDCRDCIRKNEDERSL